MAEVSVLATLTVSGWAGKARNGEEAVTTVMAIWRGGRRIGRFRAGGEWAGLAAKRVPRGKLLH
jgi:hypothetical protein